MEFKICLKKLIRTPVKTFLFFLLLAITGALLSIGTSLLINARVNSKNIEDYFTTIATINFDKVRADYIDPLTEVTDENLFYEKMASMDNFEEWREKFIKDNRDKAQLINKSYYNILHKASESKIGKSEVRRMYLGVSKKYIPSTLSYVSIARDFAVLDVTYISHRDVRFDKNYPGYDPMIHDGRKFINFKINDAFSVHPLYKIPDEIEIDSYLHERKKRGEFELGKRYLLAGYVGNLSLKDSDFDNGHKKLINYFTENSFSGSYLFLFDSDLNFMENRLSADYFNAYIELNGDMDIDVFLNSDKGAKYKHLIENCEFYNTAICIVTVDNIKSVFSFNQNSLRFEDGREITPEEYEKGENVCIIGKSFAKLNNLNVGDELDLSYLEVKYGYYDFLGYYWDIDIDPYSPIELEEKSFKIVGISDSTSNTIYVPSKSISTNVDAKDYIYSVDEKTGYLNQVPPYNYSIVIPNDKLDEFRNEMMEKGIDQYFQYFDQGYSSVKSVIKLLIKNAIIILSVCFVVWILVIILFVLLYIVKEKSVAGIMLSLGVGAKKTFMHLLISCILIALPSTLVGGIASSILENKVTKLSYNMAVNQIMDNSFDMMYSDNVDLSYNVLKGIHNEEGNEVNYDQDNLFSSELSGIALIVEFVQFIIILCIGSIFIYFMLRKNPIELVKGKE